MKQTRLTLALISISFLALGQQVDTTRFKKIDSLKYTQTDNSLYKEIQQIWLSQDGISYVTLPYAFASSPVGDRRVELREGEGKSGGLVFSPEQIEHYGKLRFEYQFDYYTGPVGKKQFYQREWHFRLKGEYIADNVDRFVPNIQNSNKKYRFSNHVFIEYRPLVSRSVGYMIHGFYGRDYLNIRYDDIVFIGMIGITFSMDKYYPIGWKKNF